MTSETKGWAALSPVEVVRRTRCEADAAYGDSTVRAGVWRTCCDTLLARLHPGVVDLASSSPSLFSPGEGEAATIAAARAALERLISIASPARLNRDEDVSDLHSAVHSVIEFAAALASTAGAGPGTTTQHLRDALAPHASQDGTWFSFGLSDLDALSKRLPAGAGAGDWVAVPDDVRAAVQKLDAVREEEHQRLAAGEGMRLYRMVPLEHHANGLCLDYVRSLLCAVPASPRSGAGEGEVRQAAEALLSDYRGLEAILAGMEADIPDAARVVVRVPGNAAQDIGTYGQFRALDHALKGLPASPPAPAEHGVEIGRSQPAALYQQIGSIILNGVRPGQEGAFLNLRETIREVVSALSQGGGAGRSERAVEIRNWQPIETAPSDGRTIIAFGGRFDEPTPTQADGAWWNSAAGRTLRGGPTHWMPLPPAPAQSPSTSDAEEQS